MIMRQRLAWFGLFVLAAAVVPAAGCAYVSNRGNDLLDVVDVGATVSEDPHISLYAGFLNILTLGYSDFDGTLYGIGGREAGALRARQEAGGLVLWGYEQFGYEDFDPADPDSPPPYKVGVVGLIDGPPPRDGQIVNCPKLLHLGWVGLTLNCKFGELADFLVGLTTIDIMGDDNSGDLQPDGP